MEIAQIASGRGFECNLQAFAVVVELDGSRKAEDLTKNVVRKIGHHLYCTIQQKD